MVGETFVHEGLVLAFGLGGAKVLGLEHLANLDLGFLGHGIGTALDPLDRLLQRRALPEPEPTVYCVGVIV